MDFTEYIFKILFSLGVVLIFIFLLLPFLLKRISTLRGFSKEGSFKIKKVVTLSKNVFIVEMEVKGKTIILCVGERGADVIYREDDNSSFPDVPKSSGSGTGSGNSPD